MISEGLFIRFMTVHGPRDLESTAFKRAGWRHKDGVPYKSPPGTRQKFPLSIKELEMSTDEIHYLL